jgi:tungstate transport system permease protein
MADVIIEAIQKAFDLIFSGSDPEVYATVGRTLYVTGLGTMLACLWGIPIAVGIGLYSFRGKWIIQGLSTALIGVPTVALGTLLFLLLSKQGPFGFLGFLFTNNGIIIGQALLLTPIIVTFTSNALGNADTQLRDLAKTLGASGFRTNLAIIKETVWSMVLAVSAAFNRGFGELGIAMIVGGNIYGVSRVLTTSIAVENNLGRFEYALAYAIILMTVVVTVTLIITLIEKWRKIEGTLKINYKWLTQRMGG